MLESSLAATSRPIASRRLLLRERSNAPYSDQVLKSPRYSKEEFARRGDEIYERKIRPQVTPNDEGKFALIDIETGDYEIDEDEVTAHDRIVSRRPDAQVWVTQVGSRYARRFGTRLINP